MSRPRYCTGSGVPRVPQRWVDGIRGNDDHTGLLHICWAWALLTGITLIAQRNEALAQEAEGDALVDASGAGGGFETVSVG